MAGEKKRFPWWLVGCAALAVLLIAVGGFIETVGRQGTIFRRYECIEAGTSRDEVLRILGPTQGSTHAYVVWKEQGALVLVRFVDNKVSAKHLFPPGGMHPWRLRLWAEQAYTAIHGRRR